MVKPDPNTPLVPAFDVLIDGTSCRMAFAGHVTSLTVEDDIGLPGMFTLELAGARAGDLPWLDDEARFAPGRRFEVRLGYAGRLETVMTGELAAIEPEFRAGGPPILRLRGYDARQRLQRGTRTRTFLDSTDSDIATELGRAAGLSVQARDSAIRHAYVVQANQSDMAFLRERAARIGYEILFRDGKLLFQPSGFDAGAEVTLKIGGELIEFLASASVAAQSSTVALRGWNVKEKNAVAATAAGGAVMSGTGAAAWAERAFGGPVATLISDSPVATQGEADALAAARFEQGGLELVTVEGLTFGRTDLRPGAVVQIEGAGKRFSGRFYLHATAQRYAPGGGFTTRFWGRRNGL